MSAGCRVQGGDEAAAARDTLPLTSRPCGVRWPTGAGGHVLSGPCGVCEPVVSRASGSVSTAFRWGRAGSECSSHWSAAPRPPSAGLLGVGVSRPQAVLEGSMCPDPPEVA